MPALPRLRHLLARVASWSGTTKLLAAMPDRWGVIFMLHRVRGADGAGQGDDPQAVRRALAYLRRERIDIISLDEMFRRAAAGRIPHRSVAFTIDDGYADQAEIAAPIFAEFDCPATIFLTTGFLDGQVWMWWDQADLVFSHASGRAVELEVLGERIRYSLADPADRAEGLRDFIARCKRLPDVVMRSAITHLAEAADVELPLAAPPMYRPMTWAQARQCEVMGIRFGPHSVTHPVLSRVSDQQARFELTESWRRLSEEVRSPVKIFCYPNGQVADFGTREVECLQQMGFAGAVSAESGFIDRRWLGRNPERAYRLPRFGFEAEWGQFLRVVNGAEYLRSRWSGRARDP